MSFNVFVSAGGTYHYQQDGCAESGDFDSLKLVQELTSTDPSGSGVANTAMGHYTPGITDLMGKMAQIEALHNLENAVSFLEMCSGSADGWIAVAGSKNQLLWPDTKSFARYCFQPGDRPGAEFMQHIGPALTKTGLNDWGVLFVIAKVLGLYSLAIGDTGTPRVLIMLDH